MVRLLPCAGSRVYSIRVYSVFTCTKKYIKKKKSARPPVKKMSMLVEPHTFFSLALFIFLYFGYCHVYDILCANRIAFVHQASRSNHDCRRSSAVPSDPGPLHCSRTRPWPRWQTSLRSSSHLENVCQRATRWQS